MKARAFCLSAGVEFNADGRGVRLKPARGLLRWTQADLARAAGVSQLTVRNFEAEKTSPTRATLDVIRRAAKGEKETEMRKTFIMIAAVAVLAWSNAWAAMAAESPYENAADVDLEQMASNILAASLCKGTLFNGESVVPHLVTASIVLGRKRAENAFFSGIRKNYEEISANGKELWCAAAIKAAKERNSEMLTEAGSDIKAAP
jgi:transcriptional regulator with XRE-family HTH domain